jgi:hypothetical protein
MTYLTIRNVSPQLAHALEREVRRRGLSLNETLKQLLERALGLDAGPPPGNGLKRFAGGWSRKELADFEKATQVFETVDEAEWK